jgi:cyclopropane fatty-acyl-phospholipid synthase-like methyltransferase
MKKNNPPLQISRTYYDETYYQKHQDRLSKNDRFTRVKIKRVFDLLQPRDHELVLDLGSGVGTITIALAQSGATPISLDYSAKSLSLAGKHFASRNPAGNFRGICCDSRFFCLKTGCLDAVAAVDFTEHLDDEIIVPTLFEVHRVLKKDGRFVIYTPCRSHLFEILKQHNILLKKDESHIGLRSMEEYRSLLEKAGFHIQSSHFEPTDIPVFNMVEKLLMTLPVAGRLSRRRICIAAVR